jgi:aminoglycoside phosphotransferase (APT) family kinase protein
MTAPADRAPGERIQMTVSERSAETVSQALAEWLAAKTGADGPAVVANGRIPANAGLSSTSVLFDAEWTSHGQSRRGSFVARLAPEPSAVPVFPNYDLGTQFEVIGKVAAAGTVPLPRLRWHEPDGGPVGTPFFVMDQVPGRTPLDNPPYVFDGWLLKATHAERDQLQRASVRILADLHAIAEPQVAFACLRPGRAGGARNQHGDGDALRCHVAGQQDYYQWTISNGGPRIPIIERGFAWLERHWPAWPSPDVLCWGDSRIGNVIYDGFAPAAVLDWEMATLGPRELDVGWFIFMHRFFQDIAEFFELPGLPDFLRRSDVERSYTEFSGHQLRDMDFYLVYAALRHAIIMARIKQRMIHFGEDEVPADPDDYVMHRASLDRLLAGSYGWD